MKSLSLLIIFVIFGYTFKTKSPISKRDKSIPTPNEVKNKKTDWVAIPAGTFTMGSPIDELDRECSETQHQVTLSSFKLSKYEVTFAQYDAFCEKTGRPKPKDEGWGRGDLPVINVSWEDANAYAKWMGGRLPTESEWEYACRAGKKTCFNTGKKLKTNHANFDGLFEKTTPVGSFSSNAWGLFDMHGNVLEWCSDFYEPYYESESTNPQGAIFGTNRISRGGAWFDSEMNCRSASRRYFDTNFKSNYLGFRIVYQ